MVWRKVSKAVFTVALLFALALPMAARANAATVYDGNISTTYITIFRDIATNLGIGDDYVFFRSGQYEYQMYSGKLKYSNGSFTGSNLTIYTIDTNTGSYGNNSYNYTITTGSLTLSPGNALIYSNLGQYPDLIERSVSFEFATLLLLFIGLCCYLLRSIFNFSLRSS